jgi:hypothetical protein
MSRINMTDPSKDRISLDGQVGIIGALKKRFYPIFERLLVRYYMSQSNGGKPDGLSRSRTPGCARYRVRLHLARVVERLAIMTAGRK